MAQMPLTILVDTREQTPLLFQGHRVRKATLKQGDYCLAGDRYGLVIERKSLEDLFGTVTKGIERFERELRRLEPCAYPIVLVEASPRTVAAGAFHSQANGLRVLDHIIKLCVKHHVCLMFCDGGAEAQVMATQLLKARAEVKHAPRR